MKAEIFTFDDFNSNDMIQICVDAEMLDVIRAYLYRTVDDMIAERETENAFDMLGMIKIIEQKLDFETRCNDAESNS